MKRFLSAASICALSLVFIGCGHDTHSDLINTTVTLMEKATTEVGHITTRVKDATTRARNENKPLDLAEALKAADQLKKTGDEVLVNKRKIEIYRKTISEEDRKINVEKTKTDLTNAFGKLLKRKEELRTALADADELVRTNPTGKAAVEALRDRIIEAEGPYESIARASN